MSISSRSRRLGVMLVLAGALASACGGDDTSSDDSGSDSASSSEAAVADEGGNDGGDDDAGADDGAGEGDVIVATVGVVGPKSGVAPHFFVDSLRGFELALPVVEEQFGVRIEIIEGDDEGSPDVASRVVQELLNETEVDALLGPAQSGPALQTAEIIQRTGRPWLISVAGADQVLTDDVSPNWGFRFQNTNQQSIDVTADLLFQDGNTVGIFYSAEGYGQSNLESMKATAEANGVTIASEEGFEPGAPDLTSAVRRMQDAGVDTVFYAVSNGSDIASLVRAMEQVGFDPTTEVATTTIMNEFVDLATPAQWENIVFADPRDLTGGPYAGMMEMYVEKYGEDPLIGAAVFPSYSAAIGYGMAVAAAGDPSDYEAVREALENIESMEVNGRVFEQPFSDTDRKLFTHEASDWYLHGFDENGELITLGQPG